MRNHLLKLSGLIEALQSQIMELVHPEAVGCPLSEPRHKSFLLGCFGSGAAALLVLPLHLAFVGPTTLPVALALSWMLGQLPLALYLSQTGKLAEAHAMSAALFALFIGGMCLLTGGLTSFALIWLAVVPMEAALSGSRKVVIAAAGLAGLVLAALAGLSPVVESYAAPFSFATFFAALAACIYMAVVAWRLVLDQKRARAALRDSDARLRVLNDASAGVLCSVDNDGGIKVQGGALETILGIAPRQARGDWLFQRVHVGDRPLYLTTLAEVRCGGAVAPVEIRLRKGANVPGDEGEAEFVWTELHFRGTENDLHLTIQDISTRRKRDQQLDHARQTAEEASIAKTRFIASASHELRTPLNAIIGFSDMLRAAPQENFSPARSREYAELIHQSGQHLLQVVDDILDTSRIETGHMDLSIEPVDLGECLDSCRAMMTPIADQADVRLVFPREDNLPMLPADRRALKQIVINLVSNAVKFSEPQTEVRVETRRDGRFLVLDVKDQGAGIPQEMIGRLGEPFTRVYAADSQAAEKDLQGSGLGLSIVKGLAELHGGSLRLESEPGKGTRASVRLPVGALRSMDEGKAHAQAVSEPVTVPDQTPVQPVDLARSA
ncbi:ATP-binding protein [Roseibium sp.]|uniref:PAS domain-containing sensor histidine kinase n=1 Tax=Roseibium sp. TaxID=1936156 RepID=UPI003A974A24